MSMITVKPIVMDGVVMSGSATWWCWILRYVGCGRVNWLQLCLIGQGATLHEGVYGNKEGNNAGEYITVDTNSGDLMIFLDSDTVEGFGFLKLAPN